MSVGIFQREKPVVVEIKERGNSAFVEKSYIAEDDVDNKGAVVGLSLEDFIIKNLYLPNVTKKELQNTIELQLEFHVPNHLTEYDTSYIVKAHRSGYFLLILAAKKREYYKKAKAVIPVPLGLYSFAMQRGIIDKTKNILIVYINEGHVTSITVQGTNLVFMREYPLDSIEKIKQRIQLSSQAVYLQTDRHFIDIKKIVVLSADEKYKKLITEITEKEQEVQWIDSTEYNSKELGNLLLHVGLALFYKQAKMMSGWSISKKPPGVRESIKRILIFAIPILIVFLPFYYYAGYYAKNLKIKNLQSEIDQFSKQLGNIDKLGTEIARDKAYMNEVGNPSLNFARINKLFNVVDMCRSDNLWLSSLSGKIGGLIVISGFAQSYSEITSFIKNIEASKFIHDINLNYSNEASSQNVSFQMTFLLAKGYSFILEPDSKKKSKVKKIKSEIKKEVEVDKKSDIGNNSGTKGKPEVEKKSEIKKDSKKITVQSMGKTSN